MSNKILLISQVFYPDQVAVSNLFTKLFERISDLNIYSLEVWCAQPSYSTRERQPKHINYKGINVFYLPSTNFSKNIFLGRLLNVASFSISVLFKLLFCRNSDLIVVHTTPPLLAILVIGIAKFKRKRVVYILMDIFPDGLIRLGKVSPSNPFIRLWKAYHKKALAHSEKIVAIGRDMAEWVKEEVPDIPHERIRIIPLWQDEKLINPTEFSENPFVVKYNLSNYFVVQFSGNMGLWNDLETVGRAVAHCGANVRFVFIGDGIRKNELIDSMGDGINKSLFLPFLSNDDYAHSVTACHCGLVTLRHEAVGMAVPSKIVGIMASGVAVIAVVPDNSEIAYMVREENCGLVVKPGDAEGLIKAIETLKDNDQLRLDMGRNGRTAFEKKYTLSVVASKYYELFSY